MPRAPFWKIKYFTTRRIWGFAITELPRATLIFCLSQGIPPSVVTNLGPQKSFLQPGSQEQEEGAGQWEGQRGRGGPWVLWATGSEDRLNEAHCSDPTYFQTFLL